jgi:hypothetical protein
MFNKSSYLIYVEFEVKSKHINKVHLCKHDDVIVTVCLLLSCDCVHKSQCIISVFCGKSLINQLLFNETCGH